MTVEKWQRDLSVKDLLQDPSLLVTHHSSLDVPFAQLALLGGCWAMIREYRQLCTMASDRNNFDSIVLMSRREELVSYLERLRREFLQIGTLSCQVEMFYQILMMHIHVPFRDLEIFAGRESEPAGTKASEDTMCRWAQGSDSWNAVFCAGQVIRAAEKFPAGSLADFYTISFFQAVLLLWTYGVLQQSRENSLLFQRSPPEQLPWLSINGLETSELGQYRILGKGYVGLSVYGSEFVPLNRPLAIVRWAICWLDENCQESRPNATNEEFRRLLQDLYTDTAKNETWW